MKCDRPALPRTGRHRIKVPAKEPEASSEMTITGPHTSGNTPPPTVFRQPAQETAPAAKVYLVVSPEMRKSERWPKIRRVVTGRMKNAQAVDFTDLFTGGEDYRQRWPQVAAQLAGAVVIPTKRGKHLLIGSNALREARHVASLGKPVLVLVAKGFLRWSQIEVRDVANAPRWIAAELVVPGER